jgi:hypothetical protein
MLTVNDLRMDIISTVSNIDNVEVLKWIREEIQNFKASSKDVKTLSFEDGITEVRFGVTADEIFAEQGNKSITHDEIKAITKDIEWEVSLHDMLDTLK